MIRSAAIDLDKFRALPKHVQDAIVGADALERMEDIEATFGVSLMAPLARFAYRDLRWEEVPQALVAQGVAPEVARAAADRALREVLTSVVGEIDPTVHVPRQAIKDFIAGVIATAGFPLLTPMQERRIIAVARAYFSRALALPAVRDALLRGEKIGGVGLGADAAELAVHLFRSAYGLVDTEHVTPEGALTLRPEDTAEVRQFVAPSETARGATTAAVERITRVIGGGETLEQERRLRIALTARLRDVRDREETRELLVRPVDKGGLAMDAATAARVLEATEAEFRVLHPSSRRTSAFTYRPAVPPSSASVATPAPLPAPTTAIVASLVHPTPPKATTPQSPSSTPPPTSLVNKKSVFNQATPPPPPPNAIAPPKAIIAKPPPSLPTATLVHPTPPMTGKPKNIVAVASPKVSTATRVHPVPPSSVPRPPAQSVSKHKAQLPTTQKSVIAPPTSSQPLPPTVSPSLGRQKIHDIRAVPPRLVGPIEELGRLGLEDFRKIARTPADAAARIVEKMTLLERDSYTKRAEGIRALRGSPLLRMFGEIANVAFRSKRSVEEVVRAQRAEHPDACTWEEFTALRALNAQLRG